jgi:hypothetical protein
MTQMLSTLSRGELRAVLALEVFFASVFIFAAAAAGLSPFIWFFLVMASMAAQSVLFYNLGREREKR